MSEAYLIPKFENDHDDTPKPDLYNLVLTYDEFELENGKEETIVWFGPIKNNKPEGYGVKITEIHKIKTFNMRHGLFKDGVFKQG